MKRLFLTSMISIFVLSTSLALAANTDQKSIATSNLKPKSAPHPNAQQVNRRFQTQMKLIRKGLRTGTLTKDQADNLRKTIKDTRQQLLTFLKQNGNYEITSDQQSQLNHTLDNNSQAISEKTSITNH